ncbi:MAG: hypothetical protein R3310_00295 [Candidatus Competibacteraceae bacterium]|nr:hypothetical protein [Candidatus Competibacteraceae bacterium]
MVLVNGIVKASRKLAWLVCVVVGAKLGVGLTLPGDAGLFQLVLVLGGVLLGHEVGKLFLGERPFRHLA